MKTVVPDSALVADVHPVLIGRRSLCAQIDLVIEQLGERADTADDVVDEWLTRFGYADHAARAALQRPAGSTQLMDRWHVAVLRALLLQPDRLVLHCPPDAAERPEVERILAQVQARYPLRQAAFADPA